MSSFSWFIRRIRSGNSRLCKCFWTINLTIWLIPVIWLWIKLQRLWSVFVSAYEAWRNASSLSEICKYIMLTNELVNCRSSFFFFFAWHVCTSWKPLDGIHARFYPQVKLQHNVFVFVVLDKAKSHRLLVKKSFDGSLQHLIGIIHQKKENSGHHLSHSKPAWFSFFCGNFERMLITKQIWWLLSSIVLTKKNKSRDISQNIFFASHTRKKVNQVWNDVNYCFEFLIWLYDFLELKKVFKAKFINNSAYWCKLSYVYKKKWSSLGSLKQVYWRTTEL